MARIPNHKIDSKLSNFSTFENYNGTITAYISDSGNTYAITHWNTVIFEYDLVAQRVNLLRTDYISQTTSTLVGRIVRALPSSALYALMATLNKYDLKRVARMARLP